MKICEGQCRYLLTVYELSQKRRTVRSVDIAESLSVTRPSVSRMLKCMTGSGLIKPDYSTNVVLTDYGAETAGKLSENFGMINKFFREIIKLDEKSAHDQSIQFLASFPEQTVKRLAEITENTVNRRKKR
ncbi:MAG: metal-dependent transcriptional regulator [Porcipelethomonas sp.]